MTEFWSTVYLHRFSVATGVWYVISAAIVTMPGKDEPFHLYPCFFDFTHQLLNLKPVPGLTDRKPQ